MYLIVVLDKADLCSISLLKLRLWILLKIDVINLVRLVVVSDEIDKYVSLTLQLPVLTRRQTLSRGL